MKQRKLFKQLKHELATAKSNLANLQQVRAQRESGLKDAKAKLIAQEEALKRSPSEQRSMLKTI